MKNETLDWITDKRITAIVRGVYDESCVALADLYGFDPEPVSAAGFRADSCSLNPGGEGVNESATAAKLGLRTGILCFLGCDGAGDMLYGAMASSGVDMSAVVLPSIVSLRLPSWFNDAYNLLS